ncbi:hypothetical protein H112_00256 [Trichophyton rubrum D6]|uniref:DUF1746 domain-containing protein n=3 Tax=Trichophyton rubrum TaxID=5551 RepID=A0A178EWN6_TRIRU|nr:uncharacterized protein TERG_08397 [Trichophyton rubrum CBS 118892]EZF27774.1 hypothetical protein H100_00258 [Trichophyton rubrum MR850]EZF46894.1 hypothetical protein H102_00256 [Trichophyton rubrum CBS 100081]EZF57542.1 hypothetical protein H103_00256 [Trichophyton rubrum CBS 288.86]EZF68144.1 hypothetical protein H104_00256 [Trichophyton rubrum CBS 289.86]EZF89362.1 hypothetical protein H110_00258 [Trichophyton rubrum MR1448]EZG00221.1 hypothetical protein H113_00258 [Trichophyton rubr
MTTQAPITDAEYITDVLNIPSIPGSEDAESNASGSGQPDLGSRRVTFAKSKSLFLDRLTRDFDLLIYCELSALYYMDCSIIHFAVRAIVQFLFLTPKAANFPEPPKNQPFIGAIIISNLVCIFLHIASANPSAGEASRGYLHGGLFIDFVGQKGPTSKLQLLAVDLLVICLQILMVGAILEKEKVSALISSRRTAESIPSSTVPEQDHDSEEQGLLRSSQNLSSQEDDMGNRQVSGLELSNLGGERGVNAVIGMHPRDYFHSGEALIMNLNIGRTLRQQWQSRTAAIAPPHASLGGTRVPASTFIRRQLGIQTEPRS